jgi:hypothetical protein
MRLGPPEDERMAGFGVEPIRMPFSSTETAAPDEAENTMKLLLKATEAADYDAFLAPGTESFQKGIAKSMFYRVSEQVASRLKAGHTLEYLTEIRQGKFRIFLWKLSFRDRGDEFIARLALTADGKVAGCLLT